MGGAATWMACAVPSLFSRGGTHLACLCLLTGCCLLAESATARAQVPYDRGEVWAHTAFPVASNLYVSFLPELPEQTGAAWLGQQLALHLNVAAHAPAYNLSPRRLVGHGGHARRCLPGQRATVG